jgi:peptidyl-tRNA hydrolase
VAQACHACTAVLVRNYQDQLVQQYTADPIDQMRKVVLSVKDEDHLKSYATKLSEAQLDHFVWVNFLAVLLKFSDIFFVKIEHPEEIATCIAVKPYPRSVIASVFKGLKLLK